MDSICIATNSTSRNRALLLARLTFLVALPLIFTGCLSRVIWDRAKISESLTPQSVLLGSDQTIVVIASATYVTKHRPNDIPLAGISAKTRYVVLPPDFTDRMIDFSTTRTRRNIPSTSTLDVAMKGANLVDPANQRSSATPAAGVIPEGFLAPSPETTQLPDTLLAAGLSKFELAEPVPFKSKSRTVLLHFDHFQINSQRSAEQWWGYVAAPPVYIVEAPFVFVGDIARYTAFGIRLLFFGYGPGP